MRPGRCCILLSRVLASAVSSLMLRLARLRSRRPFQVRPDRPGITRKSYTHQTL